MKTIPLVTQEEFRAARELEKKLLSYGEPSGVLFVGISVKPSTESEPTVFDIWIGCDRMFEEDLMYSFVQFALRAEILAGLQYTVSAHRGVTRESVLRTESRLSS